ncbi:type IV pilus assembly protein PilC [Sinobacterium caligoides]|uniref:Type IV pilus assembly protein PilC n=1 Tax=Sinobacterium caligoides TaxID=933926 RepID=A0A3N2D4N6_9GAMM|nr:type II secretion system F family protein [Sinobacterium caligoides]ROR94767.1 type IV pilus assembly protein PilC [Sinobacterium caligoides]
MATATRNAAKGATYTWEGKDRQGRKTSGEISAASIALAKAQLRNQGIKNGKVRKKTKPLFSNKKPIKTSDITVFTRQLATMMKAGVPLMQSFEIVAEGLDNPTMAELVLEIRDDVAGGTSLAESLQKHPKYFDALFCSLIEAGEQSGALETMLDRVALYKEKSEAVKKKIKKAMTYPAAVVAVACIVTGILLIYVVPQFAETFGSFGAELPALTLFVLACSEFVQAYALLIVAAIVVAVVLFGQARQRSKPFADGLDRALLKAPIIGSVVYQSIMARFSRTLSTTFAAGVPLVDALDSVAGAAGNDVYYRAINKVKEEVTSGNTLNASIKATDLFPNLLIQMVAIGEESGALDEMLAKVANHYEEEVDNAVDSLTSLMEPLIMSVLGGVVGVLLLAMYMPIFTIGQVM